MDALCQDIHSPIHNLLLLLILSLALFPVLIPTVLLVLLDVILLEGFALFMLFALLLITGDKGTDAIFREPDLTLGDAAFRLSPFRL